MKKVSAKSPALSKFLWFALLSFPLLAGAVPVVSVQPSTQEVVYGQSVSLYISVTDAVDLYTWGINEGFDPAVVGATAQQEGPFLKSGGSTAFIPGPINNVIGSVGLYAATLLGESSVVTGSGVLLTVEFDELEIGATPITVFDISLIDSAISRIQNFELANASVMIKRASEVSAPATLGLIALGLFGIGRPERK